MLGRRKFVRGAATAPLAMSLGAGLPALAGDEPLPRRPIPGSDVSLPVVGLGNSNAFRKGDMETSRALLELFHGKGGAYVDCSGDSRFVVAEAAKELRIAKDLFLGTYFDNEDPAVIDEEISRLLKITRKPQLDLAQSYPEFAQPNWSLFQRLKEEGRTRFIGVARHQPKYYPAMMAMMETGTVDVIQVNYSPLETEAEKEILPMALDKGVAVVVNRPFINGNYFDLVWGHALPPWAKDFDCQSWAQFSLKFILSHPAVTCVLTETAKPKHALDNIGAGFGRLPDEKTRQHMVRYLQRL